MALLTIVGNAYGDELIVADFAINPGETIDVSVELDNPNLQYIMTEFWMSLPEGLTIAKDEDDEFLYEEGDRFDKTHSLTISDDGGNVYHFLIYSSKNKALKGTSGALFTMTLEADKNAKIGKYQGRIFSQIFSDADKVEHNPDDVVFNITIGQAKETYSVEIESGSNEYGTVTVSPENSGTFEEGTEITVTATPIEGYHFVQWSDGTNTNPYQLTVGKDIQLSAEFAPNQYTVTFVFDNGESDLVTKQDFKSTITKPADPTRTGFTFKGWSPAVDSTVPAKDVTYTAQWERNSYKLTYVVDGETYKEESVLYETVVTPIAEPTKEGYTFSGWNGMPEKMPANNVTVTGSFTVNKYKLIYMIDGQVYKTVEVEYGSIVTAEPTPDGDYVTFKWEGVPETMPAHDVTVTSTYTTGIDGFIVNHEEITNDHYYNVGGQQVDKPIKGIYIKNGKKVLIK